MTPYHQVYITSSAAYLPGEAITNDQMDQFIGSINKMSSRIKKRILAENGIQQRYYAINQQGESTDSVCGMATKVLKQLLEEKPTLDFLSTATTGGDCAAPGLANMVQGELGLPPLETLSVSGICAASIGAFNAAAHAIESGSAKQAAAVASEFPSRLFKQSRFENRTADIDFDAHFLRWMLSDGAGGVLLSDTPKKNGLSLQVKWIHQKSFSGDMPTCMQVGQSQGNVPPGYLDYPTLQAAEAAGAYDLRQNIRILPNLFDLGLHEYAKLVEKGYLDPAKIQHFLCHYSSERFRPMIASLMKEANIAIDEEKWFSNLSTKGNTGAASIFIILDEFLKTKSDALQVGDQIFGFAPESGRFSVAYFLLEVVDQEAAQSGARIAQAPAATTSDQSLPEAPMLAEGETGKVADTLRSLMAVWHNYRSEVFRTQTVNAIMQGTFSMQHYLAWMESWIPQVREGSLWMRRAISSMSQPYQHLAELIQTHAGEEQLDWQVLYKDYQQAGGQLPASALRRNPGGEALNAFMHAYAAQPDPVGLLGGIYMIEGTGQRIIPTLLPRLKETLNITPSMLKFIEYHGENDQAHMQRWLNAVKLVIDINPKAADDIVRVANSVSTLYLQQWQFVA